MNVLISPIVSKEVRGMMRSPKAFWIQLILLVVAASFFLLFWKNQTLSFSLEMRNQFSRMMFSALFMIQFLAFGLIAPVITATAITVERENKTLDLLLCSSLSRFHILIGKWVSSVAFQFVLFIGLLPIIALTSQLGGVGPDEYLFAGVIIATTILTYGMIGLAFSCHFRRTNHALIGALATVLMIAVFIPLILVLVIEILDILSGSSGAANPLWGILTISPYATTLMVSPSYGTTLIGVFTRDAALSIVATTGESLLSDPRVKIHLGIQGAIFLTAAGAAWLGLARKETSPPSVPKVIIDDADVLRRRRTRWPFYLIDPRGRTRPIRDWQNPAYVKEQRAGVLAKTPMMIRLSYLGVGFSVLLIYKAINFDDAVQVMSRLAQMALTFVMALGPLLASTLISRERGEKTLEMMMTTLLTPRQIVWAKTWIALRFFFILALSVLFLPVVANLIYMRMAARPDSNDVLKIIPLICSFVALYAAIAIFCSAICKRSVTAIVVTYSIYVSMSVFPYALDWISGFFEADTAIGALMGTNYVEKVQFALGPVLSPYYYFHGAGAVGPNLRYFDLHAFRDWASLKQIAVHSAILIAMGVLVLEAGAHRLSSSLRT